MCYPAVNLSGGVSFCFFPSSNKLAGEFNQVNYWTVAVVYRCTLSKLVLLLFYHIVYVEQLLFVMSYRSLSKSMSTFFFHNFPGYVCHLDQIRFVNRSQFSSVCKDLTWEPEGQQFKSSMDQNMEHGLVARGMPVHLVG